MLLSPTAESKAGEAPLAPRLATLGGATIAIISALRDPERSSSDLLTRLIGEVLLQNGAGHVIPMRKPDPGRELLDETLDEIVSQAQGAVILVGD